jgi:hypothetical protein
MMFVMGACLAAKEQFTRECVVTDTEGHKKNRANIQQDINDCLKQLSKPSPGSSCGNKQGSQR